MKITPDKNKAAALRKMAAISLERLDKTEKLTYPSSTLVDYYDIIHKLLEAQTFEEGMKYKGEGAHQQLIENAKLTEGERAFLQQVREYRNRISYEGFSIPREFIERNEQKLRDIIQKLQL